jgi:hypothetical protein
MAGKIAHSDLRAEVRHPNPELVEIDLINAGTADSSLAVQVNLRWGKGRLVAADGLQGFDSGEAGSNAVEFRGRNDLPRLGPGERCNIGWVRLSKETEVQIEVSPQTQSRQMTGDTNRR